MLSIDKISDMDGFRHKKSRPPGRLFAFLLDGCVSLTHDVCRSGRVRQSGHPVVDIDFLANTDAVEKAFRHCRGDKCAIEVEGKLV